MNEDQQLAAINLFNYHPSWQEILANIT